MVTRNVVDSSGWLEYFVDGPNAGHFAGPIGQVADLIVPTITIYEVFKRGLAGQSEWTALGGVSQMRLGHGVDLDIELALAAARLSLVHKLPMADSIILATARRFNAILWTQDADFAGIDGVNYRAKV